jgi:hypothetical protein
MKKQRGHAAAHAQSLTRGRAGFANALDWGGVRIVVPPVVTVPRLLPGRRGRATPVSMDVRVFVPSKASNVVDAWISERVRARVDGASWLQSLLETRPSPGWFDAIAHLVADIVFEQIRYEPRSGGAWQLAEETLALGRGDCEDRATLLGSALIAVGISPYNVRVALGHVALSEPGKRRRRVAHAWVVYRGEDGGWLPLEPVPARSAPRKRGQVALTYEPDYVFNGDHQWQVNPADAVGQRERWNQLDPTFHGEVHKSIVEHAAFDAKLPPELRTRLSRMFTGLLGHIVDKPDLNVRAYDPRDHFDSGLIDASWKTVLFRLTIYRQKSLGDAEGLVNACFAAHGIADFYAHSSYAHFLSRELPGRITPFDPVQKQPALAFDYATDPVFSRAKLSFYAPWYQPSDFERFARWKGRPISGRYSLRNDSHDAIEAVTNLPSAEAIPTALRAFVGSLPHHNEIAVDEDGDHSNQLYPPAEHKRQFALRYHLALRHITAALQAHPKL